MADLNFSGSYDGLHLPYSPEAEQAVLGAIILESNTFDKVVDTLKSPDYFYVSLHKLIFAQMQEMVGLGLNIDFVTLLERLKQNKAFDESTGKSYLFDLVDNCPSISNAEEYAKIIAEKYNVRRLITASREIIDDATAGNEDPSVLIDSAEQKIFDIRQGNERHGLERINSVILQTFDRLDALNSETDNSMKPIPTGIGDLDRMITGLNRSDLIILAARPGMGKTSFALNIARNVACKSKKTVAFFSLEMSKEQLASRLLSSEALIGGTKLRTGKLTEEDHRPQIADLRDSGSIEQDADIVLFLYREGYYDKEGGEDSAAPTADMNSGECIVAKNRHGETNIVKLHWQGEFMRFTGTDNRDA